MITPVMPTYGRWDVAVDHGEGCWLYATDGRKFLDFTSGIAVTGLGHCHPHLVGAVTEQAKRLWHTSNLFQIPGQERLAGRRAAVTRRVPMMRDPGNLRRCWRRVHRTGPVGFGRRR